MAQRTAKKGFEFVRKVHGVSEYRLHNGLRVLHRFDDTLPLVAVVVTYHVGSRNEALGYTGSTHILEHLLFKDSKKFNKANGKSPTFYLEEMGASMNATTWYDRTNYFELLPKEKAEEALALEADRMRYSEFNENDLKTEMVVVHNEYERGRNDPVELLDEAMWATSFIAHPYHHPTIGWKEDIESANIPRLREFYDRFYYPNNATLTVMGDMNEEELSQVVTKTFGVLPSSPKPIPGVTIKEPEQTGLRTSRMTYPGNTTLVEVAQRAPKGTDKEFASALVVAYILAGGLSSRLDRKLLDTGLAVYASPFLRALHDPSLFTLTCQATPRTSPEKILEVIENEYADICKNGVSASELARVKMQLLSQHSYDKDGILREAKNVSEAIAAGDWTLEYRLKELVQAVTQKDVHAVARKLLSEKGRVVGILEPEEKKK